MKLKPSPFFCRAKYSTGTLSCAGVCAALAFSFLYVSSARAETRVWDGGATASGTNGTGVNMGTANNWGTPGNPTANALPLSGDTLEFSGYDSSTTDLVMNAAFFAVPGAFAAINVNQTNPLTFAGISGTSYLRMAPGSNFTVTNGAVTFNAGRIVFGVGTATTESFTLTNNSASPVTWGTGAATPITVGTGPAAGGGRNMTFAGSGNWVFNSKFDGILAVVTKTGTGTLTLNAAGNNFANAATTPLTISQGSIVLGGAANLNGGAYASPIQNSGALVYSSSASQTLSGAITGAGSLEKSTGTSSLTLAGVNNYSGTTTLASGTLAFTGDSTIGSLSVADQTTLAVKLAGPSVSPLKPSSLALGATPTEYSYLSVDFAGSTNPTVPVIDVGAGPIILNGEVDVSLSGLTALTTSTNTIKLLNYSSLTGTGYFNLLTTSSGHSTYELNQTAKALYLNVTATANIWKGTVNNSWDYGTLNWSLPDGYLDGDAVIFNDTASLTTVNLPSSVSPGAVTFSNSSAKTYTLASDTGFGVIGGTSPLTLNGTNGTVIITNTNTYTGTTTIGAGNTLRLGDGTTDGSIANTSDIVNNGTLVYNRIGTAFTYSGVISGSGSVLKEGTGTQLLGGTNTYSGGTTINGGDLQIQNGNAFGTGPLTLVSGSITARITSRIVPNPATVTGDFTLNSATAGGNLLTLSGNVDLTGATRTITVANTGGSAITGVVSNGGITKVGTGTLTLAGINTYTGPTLISEGRLQIGNGVLDGSIDTTSSIVNNGTLAYNFAGPHTISMPISGTGALVKAGAGTVTLTGTNTYAGTTTITGGILVAQNNSSLGSGGLVSIVNRNGGLQLTGGITLSNNFVTSNDGTVANGYAIDNVSGNNTISGTVSLIDGGGDTIIQSDSGALNLTGAVSNGYTAARTLILRGASTDANTVSGAISDGATAVTNLTKREAGNWSLTGANTYTGTTTVEGGTLTLTSPYLADTAAVVIASGAVLNLNYTGTDQVVSLTVGGTAVPNGLYTKDSLATLGFITGNGKIQVGAATGGYAAWAEVNAPGQTKDQDYDNDGVENGIEYFMGATGSSFTANPGLSGGTVTWTKGASYTGTYGTDFVIQSSTDLVNWTPLPEVGSGVVNTTGSVTYTPPTGQTKLFTRLVVNN